jgi:predicted nucleic acid-binding protein
VLAAIQLHRLTRISFWDALIVHAAHAAGCRVLYTEDFQPNSMMSGVRVVNPFI